MKNNVSKKQNIPSDHAQNRCIWMTAGVISFKLCPLNYDCEHCDFDRVIQSQVKSGRVSSRVKRHKPVNLAASEGLTSSGVNSKKAIFFTFSVGELDERVYLHPTHLWVRQIEDCRWRMGMDALLAYVLPPPAKIEFNQSDQKLTQNRLFGRIHTEPGMVLLTAPLSGHLARINARVSQSPETAQQDPYEEGWLAEIEWLDHQAELQNLYTGLAGRRFLEEEAQHLKFLLKHRGIEVNNIGETLPDGGVNIRHLHQILPSQVCLGLTRELMLTGKQAW